MGWESFGVVGFDLGPLLQGTLGNFQKIFPSPKMAAILNFQIFAKFSTHRVSKECTLCNFPNIFPSTKMAAILNFRMLAKNGKTQICFHLLNRAR